MAAQLWRVVGGEQQCGILVREGPSTATALLGQRLAAGALVSQLELHGGRLRYRRITGCGPEEGWVSVVVSGRALCTRTEDVDDDIPAASVKAAVGVGVGRDDREEAAALEACGPEELLAGTLRVGGTRLRHPVRAVIFDMYDTLLRIQHRGPWRKFFRAAADKGRCIGLGSLDIARASLFVQTHLGAPAEVAVQAVVDQLPGIDLGMLESLLSSQAFEREVFAEVASAELFPETRDSLTQLRKAGFKVGLVSNLASPYAAALEACGIQNLFDVMVFSFQEGLAKGQPGNLGIYQRAHERLSVPLAECLFVGDSVVADYSGPIEAGMQAVHLDRSSCSVGAMQAQTLESSRRPRLTISSLAELEVVSFSQQGAG